jgi:hypothetical protein
MWSFYQDTKMFVSNIALHIAFVKLNRYIKTNFMIIDGIRSQVHDSVGL